MEKKAWIIDVNMGYGHQRTAYPLLPMAQDEKNINANSYPGISLKDKSIWSQSQEFYEFISRFKKIPFIGEAGFALFNEFQKIQPFYPKRDMSGANIFFRATNMLIWTGWGKDLINQCAKTPVPFVTTFFVTAFMAEHFNYPNEIYCIVCDTDIARPWAPLNPKKSRIKYFAPTRRVVDRLVMYGVRRENIFYTGFPLPLENVGIGNLEILKGDLANRLVNLDPKKVFYKKYKPLIDEYVGPLPEKSDHPLTMLFSVGGAGAQKEEGMMLVEQFRNKLQKGEMKIILSPGIRKNIADYFTAQIKKLSLSELVGKSLEILYEPDIVKYFDRFNACLRKTDILWTKPSELSFYSNLAIPIMILPTIGYQEDFNKRWLLRNDFGFEPEDMRYAFQWIYDYLDAGLLADCAMQGLVEGEQMGAFKIRDIIWGNSK